MEKTHRCSPTIVISVQGENHPFQPCSLFWSPLHLTVVPVVVNDGHTHDDDEDDETMTEVYHLTLPLTPDSRRLAVLTRSANVAHEMPIVWTTHAMNERVRST